MHSSITAHGCAALHRSSASTAKRSNSSCERNDRRGTTIAVIRCMPFVNGETAILSMAVFVENNMGNQHPLLIQDHQRLAGQGRRPGAAQVFEAMLGRREMIAIK